jgi:hypothetical protein
MGPANEETKMDILHIGGAADGDTLDLPGNVMSARHSFKLNGDFPMDALRHHDYNREIFLLEKNDDQPEQGVQLMVWEELPKSAVIVLIEARLGRKVVTNFPEAN